jgi:hypothetical protein
MLEDQELSVFLKKALLFKKKKEGNSSHKA